MMRIQPRYLRPIKGGFPSFFTQPYPHEQPYKQLMLALHKLRPIYTESDPMSIPKITGLDATQIDSYLKSKSSFEVIGLRGNFIPSIKHIETRIESQGLKCRVISDTKVILAQAGSLGFIAGLSVAISGVAAIITGTTIAAHRIATYDPDYEIIKDYINQSLIIQYKK
jgi:hypothetical protein